MHIGLRGGRDHLEDTGTDGRIKIRMYLTKIGWKGVGCIHLAQD